MPFERIPVDRPFLLVAALLALSVVVLVRASRRSSAGRAYIHGLHFCEGTFLALLLLAMIVLSFLQILLRNVVQTGFVWIDPLLRHLVLWVGFLGALLATRSGRHINIDALSRLLHPSVLRVTRTVTNLLAAVVSLLLCNASLKLVREEALAETSGFLDLPIWMLQVVMPVALWGMAVRFAGHAWEALRKRPSTQVPEVRM